MGQAIAVAAAGGASAVSRAGDQALKKPAPQIRRTNGAERGNHHARPFVLSKRQREVLALAAQGLAGKEIGASLGCAEHTVRLHLIAVREKLSARNTTHAVALALTYQIISLEDKPS